MMKITIYLLTILLSFYGGFTAKENTNNTKISVSKLIIQSKEIIGCKNTQVVEVEEDIEEIETEIDKKEKKYNQSIKEVGEIETEIDKKEKKYNQSIKEVEECYEESAYYLAVINKEDSTDSIWNYRTYRDKIQKCKFKELILECVYEKDEDLADCKFNYKKESTEWAKSLISEKEEENNKKWDEVEKEESNKKKQIFRDVLNEFKN